MVAETVRLNGYGQRENFSRVTEIKKEKKTSDFSKLRKRGNEHRTNKSENPRNLQLFCQTTCTHRWSP